MNNMEEKAVSIDMDLQPEHLCYVRCNFCNTVLAVVIPCKRLMETVTVKCGHCGNVSFLSSRPPLRFQGQCLDHHLSLQSFNFMDKPGTTGGGLGLYDNNNNTTIADQHKKGLPSSSYSTSPTTPEPVSPPPFVIKPPEKKHRLPSAYNRFMKDEIQRIKAANPEIPHREAFSTAAKNWARFLPETPASGSLATDQTSNNN